MDRTELEAIKARSEARRAGTLYEHPLPLTMLTLDQIRYEREAKRQAKVDADPIDPSFDACYGVRPPRRMRSPGASFRKRQCAACSGPRSSCT